MKEITLRLSHRPGMKPMPSWPAFEVPDTEGLLAVHRATWGDSEAHPSNWTATHVPSGCSLPLPVTNDRDLAAGYAAAFYAEAMKIGVDLRTGTPLDTLGVDKVR